MASEKGERRKPHGVRPGAEMAAIVRGVVEDLGLTGASVRLGLGKETILRVIARSIVHAGTLSRAREALGYSPEPGTKNIKSTARSVVRAHPAAPSAA